MTSGSYTSNTREIEVALEAGGDAARAVAQFYEAKLDSLEEQLKAQQRLLFAADEAFRWVAREYPKVIREMPPNLYRELREARVPYPASRQDA